MVFVTEVDLPQVCRTRCQTPPLGAFRNAGHGAHRRWRREREAAAAVRYQRCVADLENLRDDVLGCVPSTVASKSFISEGLLSSLPSLPALTKDFRSAPRPFFSADCEESDCLALCSEAQEEHSTLLQRRSPGISPLGQQPELSMATCARLKQSGDSTVAAFKPAPLEDTFLQPPIQQRVGAVQAHLQGSSSWARLPAAMAPSPKRVSMCQAAIPRSSSQPLLSKKATAKPAASLKELLPFQAIGGMPRPEAWDPLQGQRARRAELQMQRRLRVD